MNTFQVWIDACSIAHFSFVFLKRSADAHDVHTRPTYFSPESVHLHWLCDTKVIRNNKDECSLLIFLTCFLQEARGDLGKAIPILFSRSHYRCDFMVLASAFPDHKKVAGADKCERWRNKYMRKYKNSNNNNANMGSGANYAAMKRDAGVFWIGRTPEPQSSVKTSCLCLRQWAEDIIVFMPHFQTASRAIHHRTHSDHSAHSYEQQITFL